MAAEGNDDERAALISGSGVYRGLVSSGNHPGHPASSPSDNQFTGNGKHRLVALCILVTELCERLTFYGLTANLVLFCKDELDLPAPWPSTISLIFIGTCYLLPLLGGWLADTYMGKYNVIYGSSLIYVTGALLMLPVSNDEIGHNKIMRVVYFVFSIMMIAVGTGGIKANVAPFGAEQLEKDGPTAVQTFFIWFYWFINVGSLVAFTAVVYVQQKYTFFHGYVITACSMLLAILTFVAARNKYIVKPPGGSQLSETGKIIYQALKNRCQQGATTWLDRAKRSFGGTFSETQVEDVKTLLGIIPVFLLFIVYWIIYAQMQTSFLIQGTYMKLEFESFTVPAACLSIFDIFIILLFIPFIDNVLYPLLKRFGISFSPLRRIGVGMLLAAASMIVAGLVEIKRRQAVEEGHCFDQVVFGEHRNASTVNIFWQVPQYLLVGSSEVLSVITGLEFAYSQSPEHLKGVVMGMFLITSGLASYITSLLLIIVRSASNNKWYPSSNPNEGTFECFYFLLASLMMLNFAIFLYVASWYTYKVAPKKTAHQEYWVKDQENEPNV